MMPGLLAGSVCGGVLATAGCTVAGVFCAGAADSAADVASTAQAVVQAKDKPIKLAITACMNLILVGMLY
jgi:hypothetical protein